MAMIKRIDLVTSICRLVSCERKNITNPNMSKRELRYIHSYLVLTNDVMQREEATNNAGKKK